MAQHTLAWLRDDFRLNERPPLHTALHGGPVTAIFISETGAGHRHDGNAAYGGGPKVLPGLRTRQL